MKQLITIVSLFFLFSSCAKDQLSANGDKTTSIRNLSNFTGIRASGANPIEIRYGNEFKVALNGSSNLLPYFQTEVINHQLYLSYQGANVRQDDVQLVVTLPVLKSISLSGSSQISIHGEFPLLSLLNIDLSGSGTISLSDIVHAENLDITISGSGTIDLEKLNAKHADISISGSGDARLNVKDEMRATISGSGKVYYLGNPTVKSSISGSGKVVQIN